MVHHFLEIPHTQLSTGRYKKIIVKTNILPDNLNSSDGSAAVLRTPTTELIFQIVFGPPLVGRGRIPWSVP